MQEPGKNKTCPRPPCLAIVLLLLIALFTFSGCLKQTVLIKVKPDGSGNIVVTSIVPASAGFPAPSLPSSAAKKQKGDPTLEFLKAAGKYFGSEVELVRRREFTRGGMRTWICVYSFADINEIAFSKYSSDLIYYTQAFYQSNQRSRFVQRMSSNQSERERGLEFKFTKGETNVLTALIWQPERKKKERQGQLYKGT